eukprot:1696043-Pyramimonas_sp.AAC.1
MMTLEAFRVPLPLVTLVEHSCFRVRCHGAHGRARASLTSPLASSESALAQDLSLLSEATPS